MDNENRMEDFLDWSMHLIVLPDSTGSSMTPDSLVFPEAPVVEFLNGTGLADSSMAPARQVPLWHQTQAGQTSR